MMPTTTDPVHATFADFEAAMIAGDRDALSALLAPDVLLTSPLTDRFRFAGRESVIELLADVQAEFDGLTYTDRIIDGRRGVLRLQATIRGTRLDELALVELDDDGRVAHLTVFMRPLPAAAAVVRSLTPRAARVRVGAGAAFGAARLGGLLAATVNLTDRLGGRAMRGRPGIDG